jgi:hypothetical protein
VGALHQLIGQRCAVLKAEGGQAMQFGVMGWMRSFHADGVAESARVQPSDLFEV